MEKPFKDLVTCPVCESCITVSTIHHKVKELLIGEDDYGLPFITSRNMDTESDTFVFQCSHKPEHDLCLSKEDYNRLVLWVKNTKEYIDE